MSIKRIEGGYVPLISSEWEKGGREQFQTERTKIKEKTIVVVNGHPNNVITVEKMRRRLNSAKNESVR